MESNENLKIFVDVFMFFLYNLELEGVLGFGLYKLVFFEMG